MVACGKGAARPEPFGRFRRYRTKPSSPWLKYVLNRKVDFDRFSGSSSHQGPAGRALWRVCEGQVLPVSGCREQNHFNHGLLGVIGLLSDPTDTEGS
jgi:hypothetical protein